MGVRAPELLAEWHAGQGDLPRQAPVQPVVEPGRNVSLFRAGRNLLARKVAYGTPDRRLLLAVSDQCGII